MWRAGRRPPPSRRTSGARVVAMAIVMTVAVAASARASIFDPAHRYRTIATDHFVIHFHQGEDALAGRLAAIAEDVWRRVGQALGAPPPARTQVVIADESELANGSATPLPYDTIVVTAAWPPGAEFIGNTDDWLR